MTESVFFGVLAGAGTVVVSEWLMRRGRSRPVEDFWKISLSSAALRSACVFAALIVVVGAGWAEPAPFTLALISVYLGGLFYEARRYRRWIETR